MSSSPSTAKEKILIAAGCAVCAALLGRQLYYSLVYASQHPQTLRPRQKHRILLHAVNAEPQMLSLLESAQLLRKFLPQGATVVVYDDSSSAVSEDAQTKQLALLGFSQSHGPCISFSRSLLISGSCPDLFSSPKEIARRHAGSEMKMKATVALTVDGTNCVVFSTALDGLVGVIVEQPEGAPAVEDAFVPSAQTFQCLLADCVCGNDIFSGSRRDQECAAQWSIAMSRRDCLNHSLFSCDRDVVEQLASHLQYGWQRQHARLSTKDGGKSLGDVLKLLVQAPSDRLATSATLDAKPSALGPFEASITFRASSKTVENRVIGAVQHAATGARLVSPQFKKRQCRGDALDSTMWKPRPMTVAVPCTNTNSGKSVRAFTYVVDALRAMRRQAQAFALQPCFVERVKLLLPVPPPGTLLSADQHTFMMLHADGTGICPVEDSQADFLPPSQHFECQIVVKMSSPAAAVADSLEACVLRHGARLVGVPFVVHAPPTLDDHRTHPLRLVVLRMIEVGYNSAIRRVSDLVNDVVESCAKGQLGDVLSTHVYFVVYDSECPVKACDGLHDWERDGDDGWEVIDGS